MILNHLIYLKLRLKICFSILLFLCSIFFQPVLLKAQNTEPVQSIQKADTVKASKIKFIPRLINTIKDTSFFDVEPPTRATLYSAVLPGLGQAYNKKYWKIPIIYGGFIGLGVLINFNQKNYRQFLNDYRTISNSDTLISKSYTGPYTAPQLITLKDFYRRNRDLSIIGVVVFYAANIIDAYVDAELKGFDVSDDLSLRVKPYYNPSFLNPLDRTKSSAGITLSFRL